MGSDAYWNLNVVHAVPYLIRLCSWDGGYRLICCVLVRLLSPRSMLLCCYCWIVTRASFWRTYLLIFILFLKNMLREIQLEKLHVTMEKWRNAVTIPSPSEATIVQSKAAHADFKKKCLIHQLICTYGWHECMTQNIFSREVRYYVAFMSFLKKRFMRVWST